MNTQSRILLSVVSSVVLSIVIVFIAFSILRGANTELTRGKVYTDIIHKTQGLSVLTASFKSGSGQSEIRQANEILLSLDSLLRKISSRAAREKVLIKQLRQSHQELGPLFDQMFVSGQVVDGIERERRNTLATQIWMKVQFLSDDTYHLMDISQSRIVSAQGKAGVMVMVLIIVLALTNGAIYFFSGRTIVRAQEALGRSEQNLATELYAARSLQQVSTQLIQAEDIETLYNLILDTAVATLHSDFASIQMLYPECGSSGELRLLGHRGFTEEAAKFWEWVSPASQSSCGEALRAGHRVVAPDVWKLDCIADSEDMNMYRRTGIRAVQTTPLLSRSGKLLGMISTYWREPHDLTPSEIRTLDILGRQAADLIERFQTEARMNSDLAALTRMHELSGMLLGAGGTQSLLQEIMETAVAIMGAQRGTLQLREDDSLRIVAAHRHHPPFLEFFASAENRESVCGKAIMLGERVIVPDVEKSSLFAGTDSLAVLREAGVRAVQSTPIISCTGTLLGVLTTQWEVPYTPNEHDLWRIDLVARQAADLIEHSQAEEALRASEERFRTAVESMQDSFAIFSAVRDETGQIVDFQYQYINECGAKLNRRPAADHIGRTILELLPKHKGTPLFSNYIRITEEGGSLEEGSLIYEDTYGGKLLSRAFDIRATKLGDGFVVIWRDVTERERTEEALRVYRDELELRIGERTAELERKNRELQEFAFVASHDLSEPLRKIKTFGDLLKARGSDHLSEVEKDYIDRMTGAANRMQELLDALLRYSRVESKGREFRAIRLDDIIKDAAADLDTRIQKIGAHVEIDMLPTLQGDPYQMRQLFQNLIANSLKYYRSEAKPFVRVYGEENDGDCRIFVEDNGIGFDEKYLAKIFEPFQRLHGRNEYQGTGIGLAICKKIVDRHGGTITARSTIGKGSTFIVTLPVKLKRGGE